MRIAGRTLLAASITGSVAIRGRDGTRKSISFPDPKQALFMCAGHSTAKVAQVCKS